MIKNIHSVWAYIVLILLVVVVFTAIQGLLKKKKFTDINLRLGLFALIVSHIQLLIGLAWYFMSPWYKELKTNGIKGMASEVRLLAVEHPIAMILAIVFITIGWSKHKKQTTDTGKFKMFFIFYGLALVLLLTMIPWKNWF